MKAWKFALSAILLLKVAWGQGLPEVEQSIFRMTCEFRAKRQLRNLTLDPLLCEIARGHSEEMLAHQYFSHDSPNEMCRTVADRLRFGHRFCLSSAENLHKSRGFAYNSLARVTLDSWVDSPSHQKNLANPQFNRVGIGVAHRGDTYLFTQLFSYEPILLEKLDVVPSGSGFEVHLAAQVACGPREGGLFVDGKRKVSWVADSNGRFRPTLRSVRLVVWKLGSWWVCVTGKSRRPFPSLPPRCT